jgi:predicted PurR-regulated permease PerM
MNDKSTLTHRVVLAALLGSLLLLSYVVLEPFLVPVAWAAILAYVTWPAYRKLRGVLRGQATGSALLMTVILTSALIQPLLWLAVLVQDELALAYQATVSYFAQGPHLLPDFVRRIPWADEQLQELLDPRAGAAEALKQHLAQWAQRSTGQIGDILGGVGRNVIKLVFALIALFFLYRDGEDLVRQMGRLLRRFFADEMNPYLRAAGNMTRAVVYGLLVTALIQGTVAGVGYALVGVGAPVLLGALSAIVSLVPFFGTSLVWGPIGLWLLLNDQVWPAVALFTWGLLLVHPIDNVIRPLVISNVTRIPFLLVMFGVLGGLAAFGLIGLFVGPVILAIGVAVWREWLQAEAPQSDQDSARRPPN